MWVIGHGICGSGKSRHTGVGSSWASITFWVGHWTRSPQRRPLGLSVGPSPSEVPGSNAIGTCSWVTSSRAWKRVTSSVTCYKQESVILCLRGFTATDLIGIWLFWGVILHGVIHGSNGIHLSVVHQKTPTESYSQNAYAWGIRLGGCHCFCISFSSARLSHLTPWMEHINSMSHLLLSLHLFEWFCMFENSPVPHVEQNLGSLLRFFTLVDTNQPSGENRNGRSSRSPCCEGLKVGWYESLTKDPLNLARRMTKQR